MREGGGGGGGGGNQQSGQHCFELVGSHQHSLSYTPQQEINIPDE